LINLKEFEIRFQYFKRFDYQSYPYCFGEFWKSKLRTENDSKHILDGEHFEETFTRLGQTLKIWQWHRPNSFAELVGRLKDSLQIIREAYSQIRKYSLLEFNEVPNEPLELIWHELGWVKTFEKNAGGYYLAMATTKPLMFLWGQTLAFDSVVRKRMPRFHVSGITNNYWTLEKWKKVMIRFQDSLKQQPETVDLFKKISSKEYGTDSIVPYGQFIDLYYWTRY